MIKTAINDYMSCKDFCNGMLEDDPSHRTVEKVKEIDEREGLHLYMLQGSNS